MHVHASFTRLIGPPNLSRRLLADDSVGHGGGELLYAEYGIHIVPVGELESWFVNLGKNGVSSTVAQIQDVSKW